MTKSSFEIQSLAKHCNEALLLAILFHEKKHGYQLALEIEERSGGLFKFNHGTLYPILHKMEKEGRIKGGWKQEGPKRKRKYYSITASGRDYFKDQTANWRLFFDHFFEIIGDAEQ